MYRGNKKLLRSARRRYPDHEWNTVNGKIKRRCEWKKKYDWSGGSLNDHGVVRWAKKRKHHRRHEIKPYERSKKI